MEFLSEYWPYLVFGGLMFLMMRHGGGCCGGHSRESGHGEHGHEQSQHRHESGTQPQDDKLTATQAKDPVCGMTVSKKEAISKLYDGQEHYFCSEECARTFNSRHDRKAG